MEEYRRKLRKFVVGKYGECCDKMFTTLEKDKDFNTGLNENDYSNMNLEAYRLIQTKRAKKLAEYLFIENENVVETPICPAAYCDGMSFIEWSAAMKYFFKQICMPFFD